jgi:hypothetical protein
VKLPKYLVGKGGGISSLTFLEGDSGRLSTSMSLISDRTSVLSSPTVEPDPSLERVVELSGTGRGFETPIRTMPFGAPLRA